MAGYHPVMSLAETNFGHLLREWRKRRRLSQLDLALDGNISTRHLSFIETGRAQPSRDMVLLLADHLAVPLRDRNVLLTAAGYAPVFRERKLDDPALVAARQAVELVIQGHAPYPAIAVDRHWTLVAANDAIPQLLGGVDAELLAPPVNVMRLALQQRRVDLAENEVGPRLSDAGFAATRKRQCTTFSPPRPGPRARKDTGRFATADNFECFPSESWGPPFGGRSGG